VNPSKEMGGLLKFLHAVERGKELHPGLYTKKQWEDDLNEEIDEMKGPDSCEEIICEECLILMDGCLSECVEELKAYRSEVMDVCVVAYRYGQFLDEMIAEKEKSLAGTRG